MNVIFKKMQSANFLLFLLGGIIIIFIGCSKDDKIDEIKEADIQGAYNYSGQFIGGLTWLDANGKNVLILSKSEKHLGKIAIHARKDHEFEIVNGDTSFYGMESEALDQEIFVYNYIKQENGISLLWKMYDFEKDCALNLFLEILENPPFLTDLDNDNIMESWIIYKKACVSDVSPFDMKIIMHEGKKKYAVRGKNIVQVGVDSYHGGEKEFDDNFINGDSRFVDYAENLWQEHKNNARD